MAKRHTEEVLIKQESAPPKSPVCDYRQEFHCQPHGFSTEPEISDNSFLLSIYKYYLCHNRNWKTFDSYIDSNQNRTPRWTTSIYFSP